MLPAFLVTIQFAVINGDLLCMYNNYPACYAPFMKRKDGDYCSGAPQTIKCIKEEALACEVEEYREVLDIESTLQKICQPGTDLNKMYEKHKTCNFELANKAAGPCHDDLDAALQGYQTTGSKMQDERELFKLECRYNDPEIICTEEKVKETCGDEALFFHRNFTEPKNELTLRTCIENTAASNFGNFWELLLLHLSALLLVILMSNTNL
ncbi:hypothetical protein JTE90_027613 [Oedothorax gibbosus]|uniref:Uncharacterized protein n=1 Tax=Oedothorax gibbosus TaxID=931172 RepID=A0AAV6VJW4_9ARAC|nr:hypothetical protein JTE90_027613 [Oedothorax gibbosus]